MVNRIHFASVLWSNAVIRAITLIFSEYSGNHAKLACLVGFKAKHSLYLHRHTFLNYRKTINRPDNSGHHLLFCSQNQQSLHILHHAAFGVEFS